MSPRIQGAPPSAMKSTPFGPYLRGISLRLMVIGGIVVARVLIDLDKKKGACCNGFDFSTTLRPFL